MRRRSTAFALIVVVSLAALLASPSVPVVRAAPAVAWRWTNVSRPVAPPAAAGTMMAYDTYADRFLFFGGWNGRTLNETWEFDPATTTWTELFPTVTPVSRADGTLVYDPVDDGFVLFGGWTELANGTDVRLNDTWWFDFRYNDWRSFHLTGGSPSPRSDAAGVWDDQNLGDAEILYGGFSGSSYLGDVWALDLTNPGVPAGTWQPLANTVPNPGLRADGRMVAGTVGTLGFLFGGNDYSGPNLTFHHLNDTWALEGWVNDEVVWGEYATSVTPPARDYAAQASDTRNGAVLLFGGYGNRTILADTWTFVNGSWSPLATAGSPPGRYAGASGYDATDAAFVIVGGLGNAGLLNDTWMLEEVPGAGPGPWLLEAAFAAAGALVVMLVVAVWRSARTSRGR